jgi:hypothetical protein
LGNDVDENSIILKIEVGENQARDMNMERQNFPAEENAEQNENLQTTSTDSPIAGRISGTMEELEQIQETLFLISDEVKECIQNCLDCFKTCTETAVRCQKIGKKHAENEHLNLMADCARICNLNADFMLRNSSYYPQTCGITADICGECADSCDRFEDDFMKECASVCRRCAESCREMAK